MSLIKSHNKSKIYFSILKFLIFICFINGLQGQNPNGHFLYSHYYFDDKISLNNKISEIQFLEKSEGPTIFTKIYLDENCKMVQKDVNPCYDRLKYLAKGIFMPNCYFVIEYNHTDPFMFSCPTKSNYSSCNCDSSGRIINATELDVHLQFNYDSLGRYQSEEMKKDKIHRKSKYYYNDSSLVKAEILEINDTSQLVTETFEYEYTSVQPIQIKTIKRYARIDKYSELQYVGYYQYAYNSKGLITRIKFVDKYSSGRLDRTISIKYSFRK